MGFWEWVFVIWCGVMLLGVFAIWAQLCDLDCKVGRALRGEEERQRITRMLRDYLETVQGISEQANYYIELQRFLDEKLAEWEARLGA